MKNLKKYLIKDLKKYLIKDLKNCFNKVSKNCLNQGSSFSLKKEMLNSTKSRSSYQKPCKTCKSLFLTQFIKKISEQLFKGVMEKFTKLTKKTPEIHISKVCTYL